MDLIQILTVILIAAAALLCFALIYYLYKIVKSVQDMSADLKELTTELKPLINSIQELSDKLNSITNETKSQVQITKSIVRDFRELADKVLGFENKIRSGVEDAVMPLIQNLRAFSVGFETFWRNFKNK